MKRNLLILFVVAATAIFTTNQSAFAAQSSSTNVETTPGFSTGRISIPKIAITAIQNDQTTEFVSSQGDFIALGADYFSRSENQGIKLISSVGECVTNSYGCWSAAANKYIPVVIDKEKLVAYERIHNPNSESEYSTASSNKPTPVITVVANIASIVGVVAGIVALVAVSPAVIGGAATVGAVAGVVYGSISVCQQFLGCSR